MRITEEKMEPLIKLKEEGKLGPEEKRRLEELQQNKIYAETTIEYIDSPQSRSDKISEQREKDIRLMRNDYLAQAYVNDFYAQLDKNTDVSKGAHAILTDNDVIKILRFFKQGMAPIRTKARLFMKSPHTFKLSYRNSNGDEHKF